MSEANPSILLVHRNNKRGEAWKLILMLRGLDVVWEPENHDTINLLVKFQSARTRLPDLLLVDAELQNENDESAKAISICDWCRLYYPQLKVILINYPQSQISADRKTWTNDRGAIDLLPNLSLETLLLSISTIDNAIGWQPLQRPLQTSFLEKASPVLAVRNAEGEVKTNPVSDRKKGQSSQSASPGKWALPVLVLGLVAGGGYWIWQSFQTGDLTKTPGTLTMVGNSFSGHSNFRSETFQKTLKEAGIDLHYQVESDIRSAELINEGKADLELTTIDEFLLHKTQGKIVGLIDHTVGADAVVLNTKRYPGLKSLPDLARLVREARSQGQQLEIAYPENTPSEYLILLLATKFEGFNLADFQVRKVADVADDWKLLQDPDRNVAVAVLREPDVTHARQQGYTVVLSSQDVPEEIVDVIVASDRILQSEPEKVAKLIEAYYRRVDADISDGSQLKQQIAKDANLSPADAVLVMQGIDFFTSVESRDWLKNGKLSKRLSATAAILALAGRLDRVPQKPNDLSSNQFIDRAANNTETLIGQIRASNPQLADKLTGKDNLTTPNRNLNAKQIQNAPAIGNLKVQWEIKFDANSTHLADEGEQALKHLAQEISEEFNPQTVAIRVIGHTSTTGSADANQKLSAQRADTVVNYLKNLGLQHAIVAEGKGSSEPLPGISAQDPRNQRTEIRLVHVN